jgi:hypothetical protein
MPQASHNTPKRTALEAVLLTDVQLLGLHTCTSEWDALTCDEQMLLEDLIDTANH